MFSETVALEFAEFFECAPSFIGVGGQVCVGAVGFDSFECRHTVAPYVTLEMRRGGLRWLSREPPLPNQCIGRMKVGAFDGGRDPPYVIGCCGLSRD